MVVKRRILMIAVMIMLTAVLFFSVGSFTAFAAPAGRTELVPVPSSVATVATGTVRIKLLHLNNGSGSAVVVTVKSANTLCTGSTACNIWGPVSIPAGQVTTFAWPGNGMAVTGITWVADTANAVTGYVEWGSN